MSDSARLYHRLRSSFSSTPAPQAQVVSSSAPSTSTSDKLDILDKILSEVEQKAAAGTIAQALPQATLAATDTLNPAAPTTTLKETENSVTPDIGPVEAGAGLAQVEYEHSAELPVEVESFLHQVEEHREQLPPEIVIADGTTQISSAHPPAKKPVIVLPITPAEEKEGHKKPLSSSIRWLVEWSQKIMKMFSGKVVYRQEPATT